MKRCPTCNQTFEEDWLSFCTNDGTTLTDEALDADEPSPTVMAPEVAESAFASPAAQVPPHSPDWRPPQRAAPAWQPPPPPTFVQPPKTNLAMASMVVGIFSVTIGWFCFGPISGVAAIIMGAVALSQIKKTPELFGGKQMAWIGLITGSVMILMYLGLLVFYAVMLIVAASA